MGDCIFCKIANGEIPSATLYEDEDFRVIPRYEGDGVGLTWTPGQLSDADKEEILQKVKE